MEKSQANKNETLKDITNRSHESGERALRARTPADLFLKSNAVKRVLVKDEQNSDKVGSFIESLSAVKISYPVEYFPDLLQIHDFLNTHLDFLTLSTTFTRGVTMEYLENAIIERYDADLYQLMYVFLAIVFKYLSIDSFTKFSMGNHPSLGSFARTLTGRRYNCEIYELSCDEFTISEVLRLHLATASAPLLNGFVGTESYDLYDAYCKLSGDFIKENGAIIQALHYNTIYQLSSNELLKIFKCVLNQILTFEVVRKHIEEDLESPTNYLGRDESGRFYWRFSSLPGIYIECNHNAWKYIETRKTLDELVAVMNESPLKQNLEHHGPQALGEGTSRSRNRKKIFKNYRYRNFFSFDDWPIIWEEKLSSFETLIKNHCSVHNSTEIDYQTFLTSFSKWNIPGSMAHNPLQLTSKKNYSIEKKLCQLHNIPEKTFSEEHLDVIRGQAAKAAFAYFKLCENKLFGSRLTVSPSMFEMFLGVQSVGELFLSFYKMYEELVGSFGGCCICHASSLRATSCKKCSRSVHSNCFSRVPMASQNLSIKCHVCQFRLEEVEML